MKVDKFIKYLDESQDHNFTGSTKTPLRGDAFDMSDDEILRNQREMYFDRKLDAKLASAAEGEEAEGGDSKNSRSRKPSRNRNGNRNGRDKKSDNRGKSSNRKRVSFEDEFEKGL